MLPAGCAGWTRRRWAALAGGTVFLVMALLCGRMLLGSRAELRASALAEGRGDSAATIRHLRRAMAYYLPGNPFVRRAHDALLQRARTAEISGDPQRALAILHELRSAILALRGVTRPFTASLPEINRRISALTAQQPGVPAVLRGADGAQRLRQRLDTPPEPHPWWAGLGLAGLLLWGLGGMLLIQRGLRPDASLHPRRFLLLLGPVLLGLLLFAVGMAKA